MLRDRTDRAWFTHLLQHPARKWSSSSFNPMRPFTAGAGTRYNRKTVA